MFTVIKSQAALASCLAIGFIIAGSAPSLAQTFAQRHPRRAEVLRRDRCLNRKISYSRGDLSGHYGQLKAEDRAIYRQEQMEARRNGGYLTRAQQSQLNREENNLDRQYHRDLR